MSIQLDGYSCIIMRGGKAATLGPTGFAIFKLLSTGARMSANELAYQVYREKTPKRANAVSQVICVMNKLKLPRLGLRIKCTRKSWMSYYKLVVNYDTRGQSQSQSAEVSEGEGSVPV